MRAVRSASVIVHVALAAAMGVGVSVAACSSEPVHSAQVRALGPEVPGVPESEFHRAGQPCLVCHGPFGPAKSRFVIAGTVFYSDKDAVGQDGVEIIMIDSLGTSPPPIRTNCVGNFVITQQDWQPAFPLLVKVVRNGEGAQMASHIGREGSCAACHRLQFDPRTGGAAPDFDSAGHVYLVKEPKGEAPVAECPVDPRVAPRRGL